MEAMNLNNHIFNPEIDIESLNVHDTMIDACVKSFDSIFPFVITTDGELLMDIELTSESETSISPSVGNNVLPKYFTPLNIARSLTSRIGMTDTEIFINRDQLVNIIGKCQQKEDEGSQSGVNKSDAESFIENILAEGVKRKCSDIHIRNNTSGSQYYYRVHGELTKHKPLNTELLTAAINHLMNIKVKNDNQMSAEQRPVNATIPGYQIKLADKTIVSRELRISKVPVLGGSKLVIRMNDSNAKAMQLFDFNYDQEVLDFLVRELNKVHGLVLITGPTGSGKTNLLAAMTMHADNKRQKISVEDPVEIKLNNVDQIEVIAGSKELTFEKVLPIVLRQDPDLLMFGEVRTPEVAEHLVQFTRTGHLVLTTTHVNSASQAPERFMDLGIDAASLRSTLSSCIGVRLVQLLCDCKISLGSDGEIALNESVKQKLLTITPDLSSLYVKNPAGCPHCSGLGIIGRQSVIEYIELKDEDYDFITSRKIADWESYLKKNRGFKTMGDRARELVLAGKVDPLDIERFVSGVFK